MTKVVGVAEFRAICPRIIKQLDQDGESVVVTKHGRPVAIVSPVPADSNRKPVIGAMRGSVLGYDEPLEPATNPADWSTLR